MKYLIAILAVIILVGGTIYYLTNNNRSDYQADQNDQDKNDQNIDEQNGDMSDETKEPTDDTDKERPAKEVIGKSASGKDIIAYHYGNGEKELLFVGGIHGGYSWNTALLAYELDKYVADISNLPENITVTIIPNLNQDGLSLATGKDGIFTASDISAKTDVLTTARFNSNNVDLNRNFACEWKESAVWQNKTVSGGSAAFSESEAVAMKNYIETNKPTAVVVWFSAEGKVYPSACGGEPSQESVALAKAYATASGYPREAEFDAYAITGDMVNWIAKQGIPAISVLLTDHKNTEWGRNKAGFEAVLNMYSK